MNRISRILVRALAIVLIVATSHSVTGQPVTLVPNHLRTEGREAPLSVNTTTPRLSWTLHAISVETRAAKQMAYRILAASSPEKLKFNDGDMWDSGRVSSSTYWQIPYAGKSLNSRQTVHWKVQIWSSDTPGAQPGPWSEMSSFSVGLLHESDWTAHWIAAEPDKPRSPQALETDRALLDHMPPPLPVFRRDIALRKPVKQALLYVSGLGQYEFRINGSNVTRTVLNPGWTNYRKTINYDTYDVAHLLHPGANSLGAMLGNGMYNVEGVKGRYTKFIGSFGQPKLIAQLEVTYSDGSTQTFTTDRSWKSNPGPIVFSSTYGGEDYDARTLPDNWDQPAFDMHAWQPVYEVDGPGGKLLPSKNTPLVVAETRKPLRITKRGEGVAIYDLGTNMSGWLSITVKGQSGARVILRAGELLTSDGGVTQHSADAGPGRLVLFQYTLRGTPSPEHWSPRFSYYGFRYIEVTVEPAAPGGPLPKVLALNGEFVHASVETVGSFNSSNTLYNRIHTLIDQAVLSNVASVLTDCPHREKLGWLEQTYLNASTLMLNYDMSGLYEKMSDDMADSQLPNGLVPEIAPEYVAFVDAKGRNTDFRDSPEWGSAVVLSPWALYQFTGDEEPLRVHYDSMKRYVEYLHSRSINDLLDFGLGDWYDIGPKPPGEAQLTSKLLTASATYYEDLVTMARVAAILGKHVDASAYQREADTVRDAFNAQLFHPESNQYDRGSQTANAMPLALGIVPPEHIRDVLANLVADIHSHADHVTAGDVGFHYVVRALTDHGRSDVLAAMLARTDPPSYGDQLERGATTLTEAWDTNPDSSQNHFMLGHGEEWLYRGLAGLNLDISRGSDLAISISPHFVKGVDWVTSTYIAPMGEIAVHWDRRGHAASLDVTIPEGAAASVTLPLATRWEEGSRKLSDARGVRRTQVEPNGQTVRIGSGKYHFTTYTLQ